MDTESVRISKSLMKELREYIIQKETDRKVYGKISETIEKAIKEYLDKELKENLVEKLKNCMNNTNVDIIDDILEFLLDNDCLNDKGKALRRDFWQKYIKN